MHKITRISLLLFLALQFNLLASSTYAQISISANVSKATCSNSNDGQINITVSGGSGSYSYNWSGPNGFSSTNEDISGLQIGNYSVVITDSDSNSQNQSFSLDYEDNSSPEINTVSTITRNTDANECFAIISIPNPGATDNCSVTNPSGSRSDGLAINDPYPEGNTIITWTVTDDSGNAAESVTQTVTVTDAEKPVISHNGDKNVNSDTGECGAIISVSATATDNCNVGNPSGTRSDGLALTDLYPVGTSTITWTVTDDNGNAAESITQTVIVTDAEKPVISHNGDKNINSEAGECGANVSVSATATDNCNVGNPSGTRSDGLALSDLYPVGTTTITWTFTDDNGNAAESITQTVIVTDAEKPVISHNGDKNVNSDSGECGAIVSVSATATDNCNVGNPSGKIGNPSGKRSDGLALTDLYPVGTTTITWTVTDDNGNAADSVTQTINVTDAEKPIITHNGDQDVENDEGDCGAIVSVSATATDNCSVGNPSGTRSDGLALSDLYPVGTTTITWTVTDDNGNTADSVIQTITITDAEKPVITHSGNQNVNNDAGQCGALLTISAIATDNCNVGAPSGTRSDGLALTDLYPIGTTTITWTVTDNNGNVAETATQTVIVNDVEKPQVPELPEIKAQCSVTLTPPTTTDNCGEITGTTGVNLTIEESTSVYWVFIDSSGNETAPVEQKVIIEDTEAPVANQTNLPTKSITGCQISSIDELDIPTATDACDGEIIGSLSSDFKFPYSFYGSNTITWEFVDESGNITTQLQEIQLNPVSIEGGSLSGTFNSSQFEQQIDISSCGANIIVNLQLSDQVGTIVQWEKYAVNEGFWEVISNTSTSYTANFAAGTLESTYYRVLIKAGTCSEYSDSFYIRALPAGDAPTVTNLDDDNKYCLGEEANLLAESNYLATQPAIPSGLAPGDFNQGQLNTQNPDSWLTDGEPGGFTAGGNATKPRNWSGTNDHPFGGITYDGGDKKFAIAQGDFSDNKYKGKTPTTLESPIMDFTNAAAASLNFDQAFYFANNDIAVIEVSTDGGNSYSTLRLMHAAGTGVMKWLTAGTAESTAGSDATHYNFSTDNTSISLDDYIGESQVRIRWSFTGTSDNSVWALDNIFISNEVPVDTELEWTNGIGNPDENPIEQGQTSIPLSFVPQTPGIHEYGATALINGCRTYDEDGTDLIELQVSYSYAGEDIIHSEAECGQNIVQLNAYDNSKTANENAEKGAYPTIPDNCKTCDNPGTGDVGTWSWSGDSSACGDGSFSDVNDPDATFTAGPGTYTLTWTVDGCSHDIEVTLSNCDKVDFDGVDDYVDFGDNYSLNDAFSIEIWVKPQSLTGLQTIFSKRESSRSGNAKGYDLRINNGTVAFTWDKSGSMVSPIALPNINRWYHIAVTHSSSGEYKLYIDGILMKTTGGGAPTSNTYRSLLGAMDDEGSITSSNNFHGWMEELRIWKTALTIDQIHEMMNQRIDLKDADKVQGEIIPIPIINLQWNKLSAYYRFDNIACGNILPYSSDGVNAIGFEGKLINITTAQNRTAPLPYISNANGTWQSRATWLHPDVWTWPSDKGIDNSTIIKWNIVQTRNNIESSSKNIYLLGMLSEAEEVKLNGSTDMTTGKGSGNGLFISHYLKLDGTINLDGESQLIQPEGSIIDSNSSGHLEIDQQGTANSFNYNYWTSPVSNTGSAINSGYKLGSVLRDGTSQNNVKNIEFDYWYEWADWYDYTSQTKRISTYWLYTYGDEEENYSGPDDQYSEWHNISEADNLPIGLGYTMKGTSGDVPVKNRQNYTFEGLPNNGAITLTIGKDQNKLIGNPYPSAIDGDAFISNNLGSTNGTIYLWDHFGKKDSHLLEEYVGGYGVYNLSGGIASATSSDSRIDDTGEPSNKMPRRYIPVGQAFFVSSVSSSGGNLNFKNSMRAFVPESTGDSQFLKPIYPTKEQNKNAELDYTKDSRYKIRLGFNSPKGYHRQILATADGNTSNSFDLGYDAPLIENNVEDMYWMIDDTQYVIQGVPNFNIDQVLPIGMRISQEGDFSIEVEEKENLSKDFKIYLLDKTDSTYYDISTEKYESTATPGDFNDRYEIVFHKPVDKIENPEEDLEEFDNLFVDYSRDTREIRLTNPDRMRVDHVEVYSMNGQRIEGFDNIGDVQSIDLPIKSNLSSAVYIVRVFSEEKQYSKKVIIKD